MYFSPHNVLCMHFLLFVLNQCKMLVADWGHSAGHCRGGVWGGAPPQYKIINEIIKLRVHVNYNHRSWVTGQ